MGHYLSSINPEAAGIEHADIGAAPAHSSVSAQGDLTKKDWDIRLWQIVEHIGEPRMFDRADPWWDEYFGRGYDPVVAWSAALREHGNEMRSRIGL